eukprot:5008977-Prymnesium_polylepis.1
MRVEPTQQIVKGVVMYDTLNIVEQIGCLKHKAQARRGVSRAAQGLRAGHSRLGPGVLRYFTQERNECLRVKDEL